MFVDRRFVTNRCVSTYLLLALLVLGPLLLTKPARNDETVRLPRMLATVVTAVCALWAGSLYAHSQGINAARNLVANLPSRTAVAVYSVKPLALAGPGVSEQRLSSTFLYHYRYEGLRLLTARSNTYYLLPENWTPQFDITYVIDDGNQIRVELYGGT